MADKQAREAARWMQTRGLMILVMLVWAILALVLPAFSDVLDAVSFLGFPLGFYMSAQGSLIGFVVLVFWFIGRQEAIDREHGASNR